MPTFRAATTLAANQVVPNILAGSEFEFPASPTRVQVAVTLDSASAAGDAQADVQFGNVVQANSVPLSLERGAGQGPVIPDNILADDVVLPGRRIVVRLRQVAGGAGGQIVTTTIALTPIGG